jgi:hypothetical protein
LRAAALQGGLAGHAFDRDRKTVLEVRWARIALGDRYVKEQYGQPSGCQPAYVRSSVKSGLHQALDKVLGAKFGKLFSAIAQHLDARQRHRTAPSVKVSEMHLVNVVKLPFAGKRRRRNRNLDIHRHRQGSLRQGETAHQSGNS